MRTWEMFAGLLPTAVRSWKSVGWRGIPGAVI